MGLLDNFFTLGQNINKAGDNQNQENIQGIVDSMPELSLSMDDEELIDLAKQWEKNWSNKSIDLVHKQKNNEKYYLGKFYEETDIKADRKPSADNLIFESLETFLPIATKQNPEPVVDADNSHEGIALADDVRRQLIYLADTLRLKLALKQVTRNWALYFLGCLKIGWSEIKNEIDIKVIRPQKLILDPDSTIVSADYTGRYIGEYCKDTADMLIRRFPKKSAYIKDLVKGKMGSEIQYIEWWTPEYCFWTLKDEVLDKVKNFHWNYPQKSVVMDEYGMEQEKMTEAKNHFPVPQMPYVFLSVFNLGLNPFDDTNLIHQNISLQDLIHKRIKQIDTNADNTNGGSVVSGDFFSKEQAAQVGEALRRGKTIWVPRGNVNAAYKRDTGTPLPQFVYESLLDYRNELRNIFGTRGSTPAGISNEKTVRGKIINRESDSSRIGGGFIDYLEQFSDKVFNWWVQMMYVYYDEPHTGSIIGKERAREYFSIMKSDFSTKLCVSVKDGSLIPKDPLTKHNQAIDLAAAGLLDPISLFTALEFPNPRETALSLVQYRTNPLSLFPELMQPQMGIPPIGGQPTIQPQQGLPPQQGSPQQIPMSNVPIT